MKWFIWAVVFIIALSIGIGIYIYGDSCKKCGERKNNWLKL